MPELASDQYYLAHLQRTQRSLSFACSPLGLHHRHLNDFIQRNVRALPEGSAILDGGCGLSIWVTDDIRQQYDLQSMDTEERSIAFCRAHYRDPRYRVGDLYRIPFPDQCMDAIVLREVIEHIREPRRAVREMHRVLKRGGRVILTTPNYSSPLPFFVEHFYNRFFSDMKPYLDAVHPSKFTFHGLRVLLDERFVVEEYGTIDLGMNLRAVAEKVSL